MVSNQELRLKIFQMIGHVRFVELVKRILNRLKGKQERKSFVYVKSQFYFRIELAFSFSSRDLTCIIQSFVNDLLIKIKTILLFK